MRWPFSKPGLPTSQLYGLAGQYQRANRGHQRMGESFELGKQTVIVRLSGKPGARPFHILIDDDIEAALADPALPESYRRRLNAAWKDSALHTAVDQARSILVPSFHLQQIYQGRCRRVVRIDPAWPVPEQAPCHDFLAGPLQVAFLGTRSHLGDLELLRRALSDTTRTWKFHHFLGTHAPDWLTDLPHTVPHPTNSWPIYQKTIARQRFHLCVYPARDTAVNAARSCNKVMEHAMTGSASLFSHRVPFADRLASIDELVGDDRWTDAINDLDANRQRCADMAAASWKNAVALAHSARMRQREIWSAIETGSLPE